MKAALVVLAFIAICYGKPVKTSIIEFVNSIKYANFDYPDFLKSAGDDGRTEFKRLFMNPNIPRGKVEESLDQWAERYNVTDKYAAFKAEFNVRKTDLINSIRELLTQLPGTFDNLVTIVDDKKLSFNEIMAGSMNEVDGISGELLTSLMDMAKTMGLKLEGNQLTDF